MSESRAASIPLREIVSEEQIAAFHQYGKRLFLCAAQCFGGVNGAGSMQTQPLKRVRYQAYEGALVTIAVSGVQDQESTDGSTSIAIETPLLCTPTFPNTYVEERFIMGLRQSKAYEYILGITEYTPEGEYGHGIRTLEDVVDVYPEQMEKFQPECTRDHFIDRLLTLAQLTFADEIGCEPNPYIRS